MTFEVRNPGSIKGIKILKYLPSSWMSFSFRYQKARWFLSIWKLHHMRNQQRMLQSTGVKLRVSMHFTAWVSLLQKWIPSQQVSTFKVIRQSRLDDYFTHTLALLNFNCLSVYNATNRELTAEHCFLDRRFKRRVVPDQKVHGHESLPRKNKPKLKWQRKLKNRKKHAKRNKQIK